LSTCEAEIMGTSEASKEAVYTSALVRAGHRARRARRLHHRSLRGHNKSAIDLAYNPEHHQKSKHIARRHFYVRELVENMTINVPFVQSADNLADFFTKPLPARSFFPMRDRIMNVPPPAP
jgi:hypothetical protein